MMSTGGLNITQETWIECICRDVTIISICVVNNILFVLICNERNHFSIQFKGHLKIKNLTGWAMKHLKVAMTEKLNMKNI